MRENSGACGVLLIEGERLFLLLNDSSAIVAPRCLIASQNAVADMRETDVESLAVTRSFPQCSEAKKLLQSYQQDSDCWLLELQTE